MVTNARKLGKQVFGMFTVIVGEHCLLRLEFSIHRKGVGMQVDKKNNKRWRKLPGCLSVYVYTHVCMNVCVQYPRDMYFNRMSL